MVSNQKVCVFGGTGRYGRRVVAELLKQGVQVRVPTRGGPRSNDPLIEGAELIQGDVKDPAFISRVIEGMDRIIVALSATSPRQFRDRRAVERDAVLNIIHTAERTGLKRFVYFSGYAMSVDNLDKLKLRSFGAIMLEIESALKASRLNWTVLGCAPSFELFFSLFKGKAMAAPGGCKVPFPSISEFDVGAIAAQAVLRDDLGGLRFSLTGPEAISVPDAARRLGLALKRKIRLISPPLPLIGLASAFVLPFAPYLRFLYQSLKLLNNFPSELASSVPAEHAKIQSLFKYKSVSFEDEILRRINTGLLH